MLLFLEYIEKETDREKVLLLYDCYHQPLYYLACSKMTDTVAAEDMVQETYIALIKHLEDIDEHTYDELRLYKKQKKRKPNLEIADFAMKNQKMQCLKAWTFLATILKNKITDWHRSRKRVLDYSVELTEEEKEHPVAGYMETDYIEKERTLVLKEIISTIESPYKEALTLRYYNELSMEAIGVILRKSTDNVRQLLRRGRMKVKKELEKRGYCEI